MNILVKAVSNIARTFVGNTIGANKVLNFTEFNSNGTLQGSIVNRVRTCLGYTFQGSEQIRNGSTIKQLMKRSLSPLKPKEKRRPLDGKPFMKGVVLRTVIKKPKKPNSANRKCVIVKLTNGKEMTAYVPGIGHNLQEHNVVLVRVGRVKDTPGVKIKCVRGKYDLPHAVKSST